VFATPYDLDLIRKYNVPGPRYTSYPPATRFTDDVRWPALADEILANNQSERDLSLYFHIPFCRTLCWYCGCTTVITTQQNQSATYLDYLKKELRQLGAVINPRRKVVQLHWGGGTPTFMTPDEIRALGAATREQFAFASDLEAGVEIDPRRITREHLQALREAGFNRASIGVQDFDPKVQVAVHRIQPYAQTKLVIHELRALGFESINIDLIYGLPYQTDESFSRTLEAVLHLAPDRLAIFSYAHVPWIKPSQKILTEALPATETKLRILQRTVQTLRANGYGYIGMDHFARCDDELACAQREKTLHRNFQGYSTRGDADIYSFGMSSISQTPNAYWQNHKQLPDYYAALDAGKSPVARGYLLTDDDKLRRDTIMRLMCDLSLDFNALSRKHGVNFPEYFGRELASLGDLEADGLICPTSAGLEVTPRGRFFLRNIAMRFDAYLPRDTEQRFSKTI
jgi:oxygen-independent coproporphyrinogen III oxidase